jgi:hypothetical protein
VNGGTIPTVFTRGFHDIHRFKLFLQKSEIEKSRKCKKPKTRIREILTAKNGLRNKTAEILSKAPRTARTAIDASKEMAAWLWDVRLSL